MAAIDTYYCYKPKKKQEYIYTAAARSFNTRQYNRLLFISLTADKLIELSSFSP